MGVKKSIFFFLCEKKILDHQCRLYQAYQANDLNIFIQPWHLT
jgi:hypothetical protein